MAIQPFEEQNPWERGFAQIFADKIAPALEPMEDRRQREWARRKSRMQMWLIIAALVAAGGIALTVVGQGWVWAVFGIVLAIMIALAVPFGIMMNADAGFRERVSHIVLPPAIDFVGDITRQDQPDRTALRTDVFQDLGLVDTHTGKGIDDLFTGAHRGCAFQIAEVSLTRMRTSNSTVTSGMTTSLGPTRRRVAIVFTGLMVSLDRPDDGGQKLMILPSDKEAPPNLPRAVKPVEAEGPLAGRVKILSDEPEATRTWLTGSRQQRLGDWLDSLPGLRPRLAITEDRVWGVVPVLGDQFAVGRINVPLDQIAEEVRRLLAELTLAQRLIDALAEEDEASGRH
jgi:hypothetical protein